MSNIYLVIEDNNTEDMRAFKTLSAARSHAVDSVVEYVATPNEETDVGRTYSLRINKSTWEIVNTTCDYTARVLKVRIQS